MVASEKADLEELVFSIDELSESDLVAVLTGKSELRTLEIVGGSVKGRAVPAIAELGALISLRIVNASMTYSDLMALVSSENFQRRMGRRFKLHVKVPPIDRQKADTLHRYGLNYKDGTVFG